MTQNNKRMTNPVIISFLVPAYNEDKHIERCLASIRNSKKPEYEIIVANDRSTDKTEEILENQEQKYNDIRIINNKNNQGLGAVRNLLLDEARGEYIYYVDADDYLAPDTNFIKLLSFMHENDLEILEVAIKGIEVNSTKTYSAYKPELEGIVLSGDQYLKIIYSFIPSLSLRVYRREFILSHKIRFRERRYEDVIFSLSSTLKCKKMTITNETIYIYEQLDESIMRSSPSKDSIRDAIALSYDLEDIFLRNSSNKIILKSMTMSGIRLAYKQLHQFNKEKEFKREGKSLLDSLYNKHRKEVLKLSTITVISKVFLSISISFFVQMKILQKRIRDLAGA